MTRLHPDQSLYVTRELGLRTIDTQLALEGLSLLERERKTLSGALEVKGLSPAGRGDMLNHLSEFFKRTYVDKVVPVRVASTFVQLFGDVYAIEADHPWYATLKPEAARTEQVPNQLRLRGLPNHLWAQLPLRAQNLIIKRAQEGQLHFARLRSLAEKGTPFLSLAATDLQQSVASACTGHFSASRWSALHACEKVFKAVIQAFGEVPKKTHDLGKLALRMRQLSGVPIAPNRYDGIEEPTLLRYSQESTYTEAERTFIQTLRVVSFVFPVLRAKLGTRQDDLAGLEPSEASVGLDRLLLLSRYPGVWTRSYWQRPFTGVYGATIDFDWTSSKCEDPIISARGGASGSPQSL